jgi:PAS domain-containing protein
MGVMAARAQRPLELILARNLLTSISTPAFLVDDHAALVFYNEAAGALLGRSFEDVGRMSPEEWTSTYGPFGEDGKPVALDDLPTTQAVRNGRPAHAVFRIRSANGAQHEIESSAFPIVASEAGSSGAMIFFWPLDANGGGEAPR